MCMSKLEQFIKDNREDFDSYEPGDHVWDAVQKELPLKKAKAAVIRTLWLKWSAAAAAAVIVLVAVYYTTSPDQKNPVANTAQNKGVPPEYAEEVYHFTRLIEIKHKELKKVGLEQPDLYRRFTKD